MERIDFEKTIEDMFEKARKNGLDFKTIIAGELHEKVGGYPGTNHRMPTCCDVMRKKMKDGDMIIETPPKGDGASLKIKYRL